MNTLFRLHKIISLMVDKWQQLWTVKNVQPANMLKHDFKKGKGPENAMPVDQVGYKNELTNVSLKEGMFDTKEIVGYKNELSNVTLKVGMFDTKETVGYKNELTNVSLKEGMFDAKETIGYNNILADVSLNVGMFDTKEAVGYKNELVDTTLVPSSAFITVINNSDKILTVNCPKIVVTDTVYNLSVTYIEGYNYVAGDITVNDGELSEDGTILTITFTGNTEIIFN